MRPDGRAAVSRGSPRRPPRDSSVRPSHDDAADVTIDVTSLGTTMMVWAHPDDETYLVGGLTAMLRDRGARVVRVTATRGEAGGPVAGAAARARLADVRTRELEGALRLLGVERARVAGPSRRCLCGGRPGHRGRPAW